LRRKLYGRGAKISSSGRIEIELPSRFSVEPFTGSVELLENVFDHAVRGMHAAASVIVADPTVGHRCAGFCRDDEVVAPPLRIVQGADVARTFGWIGPETDARGADGVGCVAIKYLGGVVIRIPREYLALAVQEELVDFEIGRDGGHLDVT